MTIKMYRLSNQLINFHRSSQLIRPLSRSSTRIFSASFTTDIQLRGLHIQPMQAGGQQRRHHHHHHYYYYQWNQSF